MSATATHQLPRSGLEAFAPDRLIHALAQLPDRVSFRIPAESAQHEGLERLATAYGVAQRVTLVPPTEAPRLHGATPPQLPPECTFAELVETLYGDGADAASFEHDDSILAGHRVALITNIPAQYRVPLFSSLANRLAKAGADFRVFFLRESSGGRPWLAATEGIAFDHEVLRSIDIPIRQRRPSLPITIGRRIAAFRPTIVVSGGFSPLVSGRVAALARKHRIPFGLWSGEHAAMPTAQSALRRLQRRRLLALADFGVAYGSASASYLHALNGRLPIVHGRNTSVPGSSGRERPESPRPVEILAVGDLASPRKGIDILLDALALVPRLPCRLMVVGGGELLATLKGRAARDRRIRFAGALAPEAVRAAYGAADVFAFPSRSDVFGLALVEAMGSGLAVATARAPGAVDDLCVDGYNAIVLNGNGGSEWASALTGLVEDTELRRCLGRRASLTIARRWTIEHAADAMLAGLRLGAAAGRRPRR